MIEKRPDWCPDERCEFRGAMNETATAPSLARGPRSLPETEILCGGRTANGGRLCPRFAPPVGVRTLDKISDEELTELQRLFARLYAGAQ